METKGGKHERKQSSFIFLFFILKFFYENFTLGTQRYNSTILKGWKQEREQKGMYKRKEKQNREKSTWKNTKRKKNKKESTKDLHNSSEVVTEVGQSAAASKTNRELTHTNRDLMHTKRDLIQTRKRPA